MPVMTRFNNRPFMFKILLFAWILNTSQHQAQKIPTAFTSRGTPDNITIAWSICDVALFQFNLHFNKK